MSMVDSLYFALAQISSLVSSLNKKNYKASIVEIGQLVNQHKAEAERHLFRCLFSATDFSSANDGKTNSRDYYQTQYLTHEVNSLIAKPNFVSLICYAIDNPLQHQKTLNPASQLLSQTSKVLKLSRVQEVAFGLALLKSSNAETRSLATQWVKQKLPDLLRSYVDTDSSGGQEGGGFHDISIEIVHLILTQLREDREQFGIGEDQIEAFLKILRKDFPKVRVPVVLSPLLYPEVEDLPLHKVFRETPGLPQMQNENMVADLLEELGYNCASTLDEMRITLAEFGVRDLTPGAIARCICMFMRTCEGQIRNQIPLQGAGSATWKEPSRDPEPAVEAFTWNVENFIIAVNELNPNLQFRQVIAELDCPQFKVTGRASFMVLKQCIFRGLNDRLPIDLFYRAWSNAEGQLSFFLYCLGHPDVICLAYWPFRLTDVSKLKLQPEDDHSNMQIWKNCDFFETLLRLSDQGLHREVMEMMSQPLNRCPEILAMTLLQTNSVNSLKLELFAQIFNHFLAPSMNANAVLTSAWFDPTHSNLLRPMINNALKEYYTLGERNGDYSCINRIVDIAGELKSLPMQLAVQPPKMTIDMAVVSHRREYLNMDKWLMDKVEMTGEPFYGMLIKYIEERYPRAAGLNEDTKAIVPPDLQLDLSLIETIVTFLRTHISRAMNATSGPSSSSQGGQSGYRMPNELASSLTVIMQNMSRIPRPQSANPVGLQQQGPLQLGGLSAAPGMNRPPPSQGPMEPQQAPIGSGAKSRMDTMSSGASAMGAFGMTSAKAFQAAPGAGAPLHSMHGQRPPESSRFPQSMANLDSQFQSLSLSNQSMMSGLHKFGTGTAPSASSNQLTIPSSGMNPWGMPAGMQTSAGDMPFPTNSAGIQANQQPPQFLKQQSMPGPAQDQQLPMSKDVTLPPEFEVGHDVELEVNACLKKVFEGLLSVEDLVSTLCDYTKRGSVNQKKLVNGVVKVVLDEFEKHATGYPDQGLYVFADLFGALMSMLQLPVAAHGRMWRAVLTRFYSLNNVPSDAKSFRAVSIILVRAKNMLLKYSNLIPILRKAPMFNRLPQEVLEVVAFADAQSHRQTQGDQAMKMNQDQMFAQAKALDQGTGQEASGQMVSMTAANPSNQAEAKPLDPPNESVMDRVFFLFNNVSKVNVKEKAQELAEVVPEDYIPWLAQYIVVKRVTTEPNFHELFVQLVDHLHEKMPGLREKIMLELFRNIKALLRNMKPDLQDFNDRTLLKNLGHFLGLITLGKNKPILHDEINYKDLLYEAFVLGPIEMHYVVPFATKTMEGCADSLVFKPPNPWTMGILRVLKELHGESSVKLNLKFEVEILCKKLQFDFTTLEASFFLRDANYVTKIETRLCSVVKNQERPSGVLFPMPAPAQSVPPPLPPSVQGVGVSRADTGGLDSMVMIAGQSGAIQHDLHPHQASLPPAESMMSGMPASSGTVSYPSGHQSSMGQGMMPPPQMGPQTSQHLASQQQNQSQVQQAAPHIESQQPMVNRYRYNDVSMNDWPNSLVIDDAIPLFHQLPRLKEVIRPSIEKCVRDLLNPVYDRCSRIALTTVEHVIRKDFGLDGDETRMRACAHNAVRFLAAGMGLTTAREALNMSLNTSLKNSVLALIRSANTQQKEMVEHMAVNVVANNMEICLAYMQKSIAERAVQEIDKRLTSEYDIRVKSKREGRHYYDANEFQFQRQTMPERLVKTPKGPSNSDLSVYVQFATLIPGFAPGGMDMSSIMSNMSGFSSAMSQQHRGMVPPPPPPPNMAMPPPPAPQQPPQQQQAQQGGGVGVDSSLGSIYEKIINDIERHLQMISTMIQSTTDPMVHSLRSLIDAAYLAKTSREPMTASSVVATTVQSFMENYTTKTRDQLHGLEIVERLKEAHMVVLRHMLPYDNAPYGYAWVTKQVTNTWKEIEEPNASQQTGKWNYEAFAELLKVHVINLGMLDAFLADEVTKGNMNGLVFVMELSEQFIIGEKREFTVLNEYDLYGTFEAINKVLHSPSNPYEEGGELMRRLQSTSIRIRKHLDLGLLEGYQVQGTNYLYSGCSQAREFDDPTGLQEKSEILMRSWLDIYVSKQQKDPKAFERFIQQMILKEVLSSDEMITRFFRLATVFVIERSLNKMKLEMNTSGTSTARVNSYTELDAYARLVGLLVKQSGRAVNDTVPMINLLNKALGIIAGTLLQEHEVRHDWFHPMPFQRILTMLFLELNCGEDDVMAPVQGKVLAAFCNVLHVLRPSRASSFVYSWLEIVCHRIFVGKMMPQSQNPNFNHPMYAQLIVDLFKFLRFYLNNALLPKPIQFLYKGTLRCLLVFFHDFPDFITEYHSLFCDMIPTNAIQLRNLILSTCPKRLANSMTLNDPLNAPMPPDQLSVIEDPSGYCNSAGDRITPASLKKELDSYLITRTPVKFLSELVTRLKNDDESSSIHYNVELMNSLVLYLCITAIKTLREKNMPLNISTIAHTAHMDIIQSLVLNMDNEGRYLLLNAMANQLRYQNSHTYYFSHTILYLFSEQSKDHVKEQITRVLLERLLVNRPHPWGLLMTFAELLRNESYKFWEHEFVRCAPEIESVLSSIASSCIPNFKMPPFPGHLTGGSALPPQGQPSISNGSVNA